MDRRSFLKAVPLVAVGAAAGVMVTPGVAAACTPGTGALKGFPSSNTSTTLAMHRSLNPRWYYNWGQKHRPEEPTTYVPMIWGERSMDKIPQIMADRAVTGATHLLGFNEPDHSGQANMTVDRALALWPKLEATGLRLGSPATVSPNRPWLYEFMDKANAQGRRVDFIAVHRYGWANSADFLKKLDELYARYKKPIWVTEYAVADFGATTLSQNRYSQTQVSAFMRETVEGMRARPFVERFAWKNRAKGDPVWGYSALFNSDGSLTTTGKLYASL